MMHCNRKELPPVPEEHRRDWALFVDGRELRCERATLESRFGTWSYGLHPGGYDSWWFAEEGGGGVVILPHTMVDGELLVGLIVEDRPNLGGPAMCAIGGFVEVGELHIEAGRREAEEETGVRAERLQELAGAPVVSNRAFFIADPRRGEGVHLFELSVPPDELDPDERPDADRGSWRWRALPDTAVAAVVFLPWREAVVRCADALALAAIARLVARLVPEAPPGDG